MLQSSKTYPNNFRRGFSLTELLVSMGILVTVMGGIGALYAGAVRSYSTGKELSKNFENSRALLHILAQDLSNAFTAAEFGDHYNFYGNNYGFTFVGVNAETEMGRVSYVSNPNASPLLFHTQTMESYAEVRTAVKNQVRAWLVRNGLTLGTQQLNDTVTQVGIIFDNVYNDGNAFPDGVEPDTSPDFSLEFDIMTRTQGILRYGEFSIPDNNTVNDAPAFEDLNTFKITTKYGQSLRWPYIDPIDPNKDDPIPGVQDGNYIPMNQVISERVYLEILDALTIHGEDIRNIIQDFRNTGQALNNIDHDFVQNLIDIKRREIWLRWLADDPVLINDDMSIRFWKDPRDTDDERPSMDDYVVADRILYQSRLKMPDSNIFFDKQLETTLASLVNYNDNDPLVINIRAIPGVFQFFPADANDDNDVLYTFNDLNNIINYNAHHNWNTYEPNLIRQWDQDIYTAIATLRTRTAASGSPLKPGVPAIVQPGFYISTEKVSPGSPDFNRWFSQQVEIHAGSNRAVTATITGNQDAF